MDELYAVFSIDVRDTNPALFLQAAELYRYTILRIDNIEDVLQGLTIKALINAHCEQEQNQFTNRILKPKKKRKQNNSETLWDDEDLTGSVKETSMKANNECKPIARPRIVKALSNRVVTSSKAIDEKSVNCNKYHKRFTKTKKPARL